MKLRIITGFLAAVSAVLVPCVLLGLAPNAEEGPAEVSETEVISLAQMTEPEERTIREIVIHENEREAVDAAIHLTVEIGGDATEMSLNEYLVGVLMGEMPASFELEALKAQAVAARTYTLRRMEQGGTLSDDPAVCQAYTSPDTAQEKWGEGWEENLKRLCRAVEETDGQVLTYGDELISATYFSCSGGKTESAQAVWGGEVPYLVSVESPGEETASAYESSVTVGMEEFLSALEIESPAVSAVTYTEGGGVDTITIGGKTVTGTKMRTLFGLRSTLFTMEITADTVDFQVQGFGHRVGMSQYGAQAMAEAGSSYDEILKWYYIGVEIETYAG